MAVPACACGHRFATLWTAPTVTSPEREQGAPALERGGHLERQSLLNIGLPLGGVRMCRTIALGVSWDGDAMGGQQGHDSERPLRAARRACEHPVALADRVNVAGLPPRDALVRVASRRP